MHPCQLIIVRTIMYLAYTHYLFMANLGLAGVQEAEI
jgi:hypothetical protein